MSHATLRAADAERLAGLLAQLLPMRSASRRTAGDEACEPRRGAALGRAVRWKTPSIPSSILTKYRGILFKLSVRWKTLSIPSSLPVGLTRPASHADPHPLFRSVLLFIGDSRLQVARPLSIPSLLADPYPLFRSGLPLPTLP
jgi:hypothetical protein